MYLSVSAEHGVQRHDELGFMNRTDGGAAFATPEQIERGYREVRRRFEGVEPIIVVRGPDPVSDRQDDGADASFAEHSR